MSVKLAFLCMAAVAAAVDEDFHLWKKSKVMRVYTPRVQPLYQSTNTSLDNCFGAVEDTLGAKVVQYHEKTKTCMLFKKFTTNDDAVTKKDSSWALYYETEVKEDDSLSAGQIVATIVLCILFAGCLVTLAIVCKSEESDIAGQMQRLEEQELQKEEAVSEHWEKKSQEAEAAAAQEMEMKQ